MAVLTPRWSRNARTASAARLAPFRKAVDDNLDAALDHATQVGTADDILP
ncbi:MAG TPA: hypothetical protein VF055_00085 [Steroidobacteraceae bacterium]